MPHQHFQTRVELMILMTPTAMVHTLLEPVLVQVAVIGPTSAWLLEPIW